MNEANSVIRTVGLSRTYKTLGQQVIALNHVDVTIKRGEFTAIVGPSGSGKSTLLNLMGGLDVPSEGQVFLAGKAINEMSGNALSDFRRDHIGLIFQAFNLIPVLNVTENIEYVMRLQGVPTNERTKRIADVLVEVGLEGMQRRFPPELSGGQQQRVAIARAMVSRPDIILADEPTANIDSRTGSALLDLMRDLNEKSGITFVFSTHDQKIMDRAKRLITLVDGQIATDESKH